MSKVLSFLVRDRLFALPVDQVNEIIPIRAISELPSQSATLRGGLSLRGGIVPLYDFRSLVGLPRLRAEREELVNTLNQREQDHLDWLDALTKSIKESIEFRKAKDPRACAFGKWYYSFKSSDSVVERILAEMERPHNNIHALANQVLDLSTGGDKKRALELIEAAKSTTLAQLLRLFSELKVSLLSDLRELAIILKTQGSSAFGIAVDAVDNIRDLHAEKLQAREGLDSTPIVSTIWSNESQTLLEVNLAFLEASVGDRSGVQSALP